MLQSNGKYIDTTEIRRLFSQEEKACNDIVFRVDKTYDNRDLTNCTFIMHGIFESGKEATATLTSAVAGDESEYLDLTWTIDGTFTSESGRLFLDLVAYSDSDIETASMILRYQLPPIEIRKIPNSDNPSEESEYITFKTQVLEQLEDHETRITTLENSSVGDLSEIKAELDDHETRITICEAQITKISDIETNLTALTLTVNTNTDNISTNTTNIATNTTNIATNASDISDLKTAVATNTTNIDTNANAIAENTADIETLQTASADYEIRITTLEAKPDIQVMTEEAYAELTEIDEGCIYVLT